MEGHKGVDKTLLEERIVAVAGDFLPYEGSTVYEHGLVGGRRADFEGLSPVRESLVIVLLLEILLVIGKIGDAFRTVLAVLSLSGRIHGKTNHQH